MRAVNSRAFASEGLCTRGHADVRSRPGVTSAMLGGMVPGPIAMLRKALANLAAEPSEQEKRLSGSVVQDELALDFANAFEALASLPEAAALDDSTMADLGVLYERFSVGSEDALWVEDLNSPRWSEVRSLAERIGDRV